MDWGPLGIAGTRSAIAAVVLLAAVRRRNFTWSPAQIGGAIAYGIAARRRTQSLRATLGRVEARVKQGGMTLTHHYDPEMPIQQRVKILQDLVWKGVQNPQMRELALAITGNGTTSHRVAVWGVEQGGVARLDPVRRFVLNWGIEFPDEQQTRGF